MLQFMELEWVVELRSLPWKRTQNGNNLTHPPSSFLLPLPFFMVFFSHFQWKNSSKVPDPGLISLVEDDGKQVDW